MPRQKPTALQALRIAIDRAKAEGNDALAAELHQVRHAVQGKTSPRALVPLLDTATSQVTKSFVAEALGTAGDTRVLKPLMRAAVNPANSNYQAPHLWACAHYDCSAHLAFFVRFLLTCTDPGESMVACMTVIEAMKGPFVPAVVKGAIARLLRHKQQPVETPNLATQAEVFRVQAAYALLDTYFDQVDQDWKNDA